MKGLSTANKVARVAGLERDAVALKPLVTASELEAPKVLPSLKLESGTPTHLGIVETSPKVPSAGVGEVSEFKPIDVGGGGGGGGGGPPTRLVPDTAIVVRGGTGALPPPGTVFSGAYGPYALTVEDAAAGVPHGTIRVTTAGDIRLGGGTVVAVPELTSTKKATNILHVNITEEPGATTFGEAQPNPVPKSEREWLQRPRTK